MMRWAFARRSRGDEWSGMENWMLKLARGLRRAGDACAFFAPRDSHWPSVCRREGFEFEVLPSIGAPAAAARLALALCRRRPDAAICADFAEARILRAADARAAVGLKLPESRALTDGFADRWSFRHAVDRLLTDHRDAREVLLRHPWVPAGKILLAPNGVETDDGGPDPERRAAARAALGLADSEAVAIGAANRFTARQRLMDALLAFHRAAGAESNARLFLFGDGPQRAEVEREARRRGLENRVRFWGWRDDAAELLRGCDIVLHPGVSPGMPNSVLEGMAAGAAVVAARAGGTSEMLRSGLDGVLYEPGDVAELAALLRELIADPERRRRLGETAARRAADAFSMERAVRRIRDGMAATAEARRLTLIAGGARRFRRTWIRRSDAPAPTDRPPAAANIEIKTYAPRAPWSSPALRAFRRAHRLELMGVRVSPHLAAGWERTAEGRRRPTLWRGTAAGAEPVLEWTRRHADLPAVLGALATAGGAWLGGLHRLRVIPYDLDPANIEVRLGPAISPEFLLRDLERCRISAVWRRAVVRRGLRRLYREFRPYLTDRQMLRFAVAYRRTCGIGRRTLRALLRGSAEDAERAPRRDRTRPGRTAS